MTGFLFFAILVGFLMIIFSLIKNDDLAQNNWSQYNHLDWRRHDKQKKVKSKVSLDLKRCNISGMVFRKNDVYNAVDFSESDLNNVDFSGCILTNCDFSKSNLKNANFSNCDITGSIFYDAILVGTNFKGCKIDEIQFDEKR